MCFLGDKRYFYFWEIKFIFMFDFLLILYCFFFENLRGFNKVIIFWILFLFILVFISVKLNFDIV